MKNKRKGRILPAVLVLAAALALLCCVSASFAEPADAAPQSTFGGLTVAAGTRNITLEWTDNDNSFYRVEAFANGVDRHSAYTSSAKKSVILNNLAPNTPYHITITKLLTGETISEVVWTEGATPYREHGFRWNTCRVYWVKAPSTDFFGEARQRVKETTQADLFDREREYVARVEFWWKTTNAAKELEYCFVVRLPNGDVMSDPVNEERFPGSWEGAYFAYYLSNIMDMVKRYYNPLPTGEYAFEFYFADQFAGRSFLTIIE